MADHLEDTTTDDATDEPGGGRDAFMERMSKVKVESTDEGDAADDADDSDAGDDDSDSPDETDEDTSGDAESDEDDEADDDTDTDDEEDDSEDVESDDDADDADDEEEDDASDEADDAADDEDTSTDETKAALARHGADLTLDDVPAKYRPLIEAKLKALDAPFTRALMEARAYRSEEKKFRADEAFRTQNQDLVIVEMLRANPDLMAKVNKHLNRMDPGEDGANAESAKDNEELFKERVKNARKSATDVVDEQDKETQKIFARIDEVETDARNAARTFKVPYTDTLEQLLEAAVLRKPEKERKDGLTTAEINDIVKKHASDYHRTTGAVRREASKTRVQERAEKHRRPKPTVRVKGGVSTHNARKPEKMKIDYNNAESRQKGLLAVANRVHRSGRDR
jgi:hypothetical protein